MSRWGGLALASRRKVIPLGEGDRRMLVDRVVGAACTWGEALRFADTPDRARRAHRRLQEAWNDWCAAVAELVLHLEPCEEWLRAELAHQGEVHRPLAAVRRLVEMRNAVARTPRWFAQPIHADRHGIVRDLGWVIGEGRHGSAGAAVYAVTCQFVDQVLERVEVEREGERIRAIRILAEDDTDGARHVRTVVAEWLIPQSYRELLRAYADPSQYDPHAASVTVGCETFEELEAALMLAEQIPRPS